ncbi:branched-chain amino acid ABC transporter permease [Phormidium sp. CLA17]|uniref:branched-chain amino acid ABC transporter permease n=1 Tax=Leptolyngbya sp. Cla-17 TaxID=2803751 RepID=UPI001490F4DF|nr:branched-chain amino acid ABC transporter permease [Leptolyngbya sp. Cla-17]MBM0744002.1 branched-chain amino acid ABC transporter permease [Leptolyngbya sp. Cla-17]
MPHFAERLAAQLQRRWGDRPLSSELGLAVLVFLGLGLLPLFISGYVVYILPQYMLFGVLAMSLALLWGFVGILSFGQGALFALGAYTMGLTMKLGQTVIPSAYLGLALSLVVGALLSGAIGYFLFSAGVRDTYFVIVTLALSIVVEQIAVSQSALTGGFNGLFIDRMGLNLGPLGTLDLSSDRALYYFVLPIAILLYGLLYGLTHAKFGKVLVGIRENEDRTLSLGFNTWVYKTLAFTVSGAVASLAGAIYGTAANFVAPSLAGVLFSTEVVVWVAISGRSNLLGAFLGGTLVSSLSNYLSTVTPKYWQLLLGILFIATIVYFKGGVAGALAQIPVWRRRHLKHDG